MPAKRKASDSTGYLLETWRPPDDAGAPLACLATTFTFDAAVFDEECLARFLDLQGSPEESGVAYYIEREEKLAPVTAAVLADAQHARGSRDLRWDLLVARLPRAGNAQPILHAKVWLMVWERAVRLVVGSANLTSQGLRVNHEVFGVLDYREDQPGPSAALADLLDFLRLASQWTSAGPARERWLSAISLAEKKAGQWVTERPLDGVTIHALTTGPGSASLLAQLPPLWPGKAPDYAEVLSPFFDVPAAVNAPARGLWKLMARESEVCFWLVPDRALSSDKITAVRAPESLLQLPPERDAARCEASLCLAVLEENRPLHAKSLWLERDGHWAMYVIGSHNFTSPGLGLHALRNAEVSLAYVTSDAAAMKLLSRPALKHQDAAGALRWMEAEEGPGEDEANGDLTLLPPEFGAAIYDCDATGPHLVLHFLNPQGDWRVTTASEQGERALYDASQWHHDGDSVQQRLAWTEPAPPSRLLLHLPEMAPAEWIVELRSPSAMPPPEELKSLSLAALLDVLTSARPLHLALARWLESSAPAQAIEVELDPHRQVDTSGFLLQRTARFSRALRGLKERLEQPVISHAALDWRLRGPVGLTALVEAVTREALMEMEAPFLLAELYRELRGIRWQTIPGGPPLAVIKRAAADVEQALRAQLTAAQQSLTDPALRDYLTAVLDS